MSDTILAVLISVLGTALFGPLLLALFNRLFNRSKDDTDLAQNALTVAKQAAVETRETKDEMYKMRQEMDRLRREKTAPIHIAMTVYRDPELTIRDVRATFIEESEV
jgi:hypothetical protein